MAGTQKKTPFIAETFTATSQDGTRHQLRLWRWKIEMTMLSGSPATTFADWKIDSAAGRHVNVTDGVMSFADTGEVLTRP